jgi:hypothetical protein
MRFFFIASVAFLWTFSVNAKDLSKAEGEQNKPHNAQPSPENPSTRIEINVGNPSNTAPPQPQEQQAIAKAKPAPISDGEWLIAVITAAYAVVSFFTFTVIQKQTKIAQDSLATLINSERSWVMVDIEWEKGAHIFESTEQDGLQNTGIYVNYICQT